FRRPLGGYFRDRFEKLPARLDPLRVLFISPYPICPPVHGGGVFMYQTVTRLAPLCELHLIVLLDYPQEWEANQQLAEKAASVELMVRFPAPRKPVFPLSPYSVHEFSSPDFAWLIHRQIYLREIDVIQLEYTNMGQYGGSFRQLASILFEHDIYFQSIARFHKFTHGLTKLKAMYEYLRALRYELRILSRFDRVQVCSQANRDYLLSFLPKLAPRIDDNLRAGVDTSLYPMRMEGREPETMLFLGGVRHLPNLEALQWFTRQVMPLILKSAPGARLIVVGSEPPPAHALPDSGDAVEIRGFVEDVLEPLGRYAVFVCPILSGSGIRVKLLEAFAAGIPVVSTRIGAEGLTERDGETCLLADDATEFARKVLDLFANPALGRELAARARDEVEARWDMAKITAALAASYRREVMRKRGATVS
ncbi:MAG: glycosyltransferase family 4 protein, partial [Bryobacteraceae bacterium]